MSLLLFMRIVLFSLFTNIFKMKGAWRCHGNTNNELINNLKECNIIKSERVANAMKAVDRANFIKIEPYFDQPQYIGHGATISAPHMHALALQQLEDVICTKKEDIKILDVGCGSGYLTAVFARLNPAAKVIGIDVIEELVLLSKNNIEKEDIDLFKYDRLSLHHQDGWKGWQEDQPYDAIHVGAAAIELPLVLLDQLKIGGRMIIPVGPERETQKLIQVDRLCDKGTFNEQYITKDLTLVQYVPLVKT